MMQSLLQAKAAVIQYMSTFGRNYKGPILLDSDWGKMSKYCEVLELFCQATVLLGGEKYVSCSSVLPLMSALQKHRQYTAMTLAILAGLNQPLLMTASSV